MKKLLLTLGPSSLNKNTIQACDQKGIFLYRINLSHTDIDVLEDRITEIRKYTDTPICLDSEGAQIRNQNMRDGAAIFKKNSVVIIQHEEIVGDDHERGSHQQEQDDDAHDHQQRDATSLVGSIHFHGLSPGQPV